MQYIIAFAYLYFSIIQVKLPVQLSLNLCIWKINYMATYWRSAGTLAPIHDSKDDAPGT